MDSREDFELFIKDVWQSPNLRADFYMEVPSGREYLMYDDLSIHQTWVGWKSRQPEIDKKDEQIKLLREALLRISGKDDQDGNSAWCNSHDDCQDTAITALEATKGE